jgi:hypothetical protein
MLQLCKYAVNWFVGSVIFDGHIHVIVSKRIANHNGDIKVLHHKQLILFDFFLPAW